MPIVHVLSAEWQVRIQCKGKQTWCPFSWRSRGDPDTNKIATQITESCNWGSNSNVEVLYAVSLKRGLKKTKEHFPQEEFFSQKSGHSPCKGPEV